MRASDWSPVVLGDLSAEDRFEDWVTEVGGEAGLSGAEKIYAWEVC